MTIRSSTAVANARLDAIETAVGAAPSLRIYSGTMPANCAAALAGNALLAEMVLPPEWMATAGAGAKASAGTWRDMAALASGAAAFFRVYDTGGDECHIQGSVSTVGGGGSMQLASIALLAGYPVVVSRFVLRGAEAPPFEGSASVTLADLVADAATGTVADVSADSSTTSDSYNLSRASAPTGGILVTAWGRFLPAITGYPNSSGNREPLRIQFPNWRVRFVGFAGGFDSATSVFMSANSMLFMDGTALGENPDTYIGDYSFYLEDVGDDDIGNGWIFQAMQVYNDGANITVRQWIKYYGLPLQGPYQSTLSYSTIRAELVTAGWGSGNAAAFTPEADASQIDIMAWAASNIQFRVEANSGTPSNAYLESLAALTAADPTAWADWPVDWLGSAPNMTDRSGHGRGLSSTGGTYAVGDPFPP